jgi:hypothetical protein
MWVNALIHEDRTDFSGTVHGFHEAVGGMWITVWTNGVQPPIANISIFGRSDVDCDRNSE